MSNTRRVAKPKPAKDVTTLLAAAKLPESTVALCLRGDLAAEFERLEAEMLATKDTPLDRLVGNPEATAIAKRMEALREEMAESTVTFRLRAKSRKDFRQFLVTHAPREGNADDRAMGFNIDTYFDDLVRESIVDPVLSEEQWEALSEALTANQWMHLQNAAVELNQDEVSVPFSHAASLLLRGSAAR